MSSRFPLHARLSPVAAALLALQAGLAIAEEPVSAAPAGSATAVLPRVDVIGSAEALPEIAGAGDVLAEEELERSHVFTVNEALRKVPGVHARDEEGFGLRPNIGMRGLNPTRSTKVTLLEDGIPLAFAPYGDNASYYHPQVDRYERIEVLKGAGSLLFGPQTIAGIVNYVTPMPPQEFGGFVQGTFGDRDYANGKVRLGGNGMLLDFTHKQGEGARDNMNHIVDDLNLKYVLPLGDSQALTLRGNYYREDSVITYTGLTQAEYENFGASYNPFKNDGFESERTGLSATHEVDLGGGLTLQTNLYYSEFDRDWWRQSSTTTDTQCGTGFRDDRLAGLAVDPDACNSVQGRLRSYTTWGIEPRATWTHALGELQAGVKAHYEEQVRRQVNGTSPYARSGTLAENNLRDVDAFAVFLSNRFDLGQFALTPIVRQERIDADRRNLLTGQGGSTRVTETMYGLGATWNPSANLTVFSSLHEGFAPPRVEDLIGGTGTVTDVEAEESTNFELGLRTQPVAGLSVQAAYFRNDFDNLIAVGSIAGGSTPLSQGQALFEGLELGIQAGQDTGPFGRLAYTWLPTAEQSGAFRNVSSGALVGVAGNRQPYAPENTLTVGAGYQAVAWSAELEAQYVDDQYADFANTLRPTADGQKGEIKAYTILNTSVNYRVDKAVTLFATGKNLADKTYIVDRTRGIQVGMPRLLQAGVRYAF